MSARIIKDFDGGVDKLAKRIGARARRVLVGVPRGRSEADGNTVAQVAAWNEFGGKDRPERPFLRTGIRVTMPAVLRVAKSDLKDVARGKGTMTIALERAGAIAAGEVKKHIIDGRWVPNAPSTIAKKGSAQPLVDSGMMRQSITHEVEGGGQ
jgi:hypothetical protein